MPIFKGVASKAKPHKVISYVTNPAKSAIVSSVGLDDNVCYAEQFMQTYKLWNKGHGTGERKYYHFKLSPNMEDHATPEQSHTLAEKLAKHLFDGHECVITTHVDKNHVHSFCSDTRDI